MIDYKCVANNAKPGQGAGDSPPPSQDSARQPPDSPGLTDAEVQTALDKAFQQACPGCDQVPQGLPSDSPIKPAEVDQIVQDSAQQIRDYADNIRTPESLLSPELQGNEFFRQLQQEFAQLTPQQFDFGISRDILPDWALPAYDLETGGMFATGRTLPSTFPSYEPPPAQPRSAMGQIWDAFTVRAGQQWDALTKAFGGGAPTPVPTESFVTDQTLPDISPPTPLQPGIIESTPSLAGFTQGPFDLGANALDVEGISATGLNAGPTLSAIAGVDLPPGMAASPFDMGQVFDQAAVDSPGAPQLIFEGLQASGQSGAQGVPYTFDYESTDQGVTVIANIPYDELPDGTTIYGADEYVEQGEGAPTESVERAELPPPENRSAVIDITGKTPEQVRADAREALGLGPDDKVIVARYGDKALVTPANDYSFLSEKGMVQSKTDGDIELNRGYFDSKPGDLTYAQSIRYLAENTVDGDPYAQRILQAENAWGDGKFGQQVADFIEVQEAERGGWGRAWDTAQAWWNNEAPSATVYQSLQTPTESLIANSNIIPVELSDIPPTQPPPSPTPSPTPMPDEPPYPMPADPPPTPAPTPSPNQPPPTNPPANEPQQPAPTPAPQPAPSPTPTPQPSGTQPQPAPGEPGGSSGQGDKPTVPGAGQSPAPKKNILQSLLDLLRQFNPFQNAFGSAPPQQGVKTPPAPQPTPPTPSPAPQSPPQPQPAPAPQPPKNPPLPAPAPQNPPMPKPALTPPSQPPKPAPQPAPTPAPPPIDFQKQFKLPVREVPPNAPNNRRIPTQASTYGFPGDKTAGSKITASGAKRDTAKYSVAHNGLPMGTIIEIERTVNGVTRKAVAVVNNRGPFIKTSRGKHVPHPTRALDLTPELAKALGFTGDASGQAVGPVTYRVVATPVNVPRYSGPTTKNPRIPPRTDYVAGLTPDQSKQIAGELQRGSPTQYASETPGSQPQTVAGRIGKRLSDEIQKTPFGKAGKAASEGITKLVERSLGALVGGGSLPARGTSIRGAQIKVSNIVQDTCTAIGGGCKVRSGFRSEEENEAAGGAEHSRHLNGDAIDVQVPATKGPEFAKALQTALCQRNSCNGGIGYYGTNKKGQASFHVDTRPTQVTWGPSRRSKGPLPNDAIGKAVGSPRRIDPTLGPTLAGLNGGAPAPTEQPGPRRMTSEMAKPVAKAVQKAVQAVSPPASRSAGTDYRHSIPKGPVGGVRTEVFIPRGADLKAPDARVVVYFHGHDAGSARSFEQKFEQVKLQYAGQNVVVIMPDLGKASSRARGQFAANGGKTSHRMMEAAHRKIEQATGVSLQGRPVVVQAYSGGASPARSFVESGAAKGQNQPGGGFEIYGGIAYGGLEEYLRKWARENPQAYLVSVSTNEPDRVPGANAATARAFNRPIESAPPSGPITPGSHHFYALPKASHNALMGSGIPKQSLEASKKGMTSPPTRSAENTTTPPTPPIPVQAPTRAALVPVAPASVPAPQPPTASPARAAAPPNAAPAPTARNVSPARQAVAKASGALLKRADTLIKRLNEFFKPSTGPRTLSDRFGYAVQNLAHTYNGANGARKILVDDKGNPRNPGQLDAETLKRITTIVKTADILVGYQLGLTADVLIQNQKTIKENTASLRQALSDLATLPNPSQTAQQSPPPIPASAPPPQQSAPSTPPPAQVTVVSLPPSIPSSETTETLPSEQPTEDPQESKAPSGSGEAPTDSKDDEEEPTGDKPIITVTDVLKGLLLQSTPAIEKTVLGVTLWMNRQLSSWVQANKVSAPGQTGVSPSGGGQGQSSSQPPLPQGNPQGVPEGSANAPRPLPTLRKSFENLVQALRDFNKPEPGANAQGDGAPQGSGTGSGVGDGEGAGTQPVPQTGTGGSGDAPPQPPANAPREARADLLARSVQGVRDMLGRASDAYTAAQTMIQQSAELIVNETPPQQQVSNQGAPVPADVQTWPQAPSPASGGQPTGAQGNSDTRSAPQESRLSMFAQSAQNLRDAFGKAYEAYTNAQTPTPDSVSPSTSQTPQDPQAPGTPKAPQAPATPPLPERKPTPPASEPPPTQRTPTDVARQNMTRAVASGAGLGSMNGLGMLGGLGQILQALGQMNVANQQPQPQQPVPPYAPSPKPIGPTQPKPPATTTPTIGTTTPAKPLPSVSVIANPNKVDEGETATLRWISFRSTACELRSGGTIIASGGTQGERVTDALFQTTSFVVSCTGDGGMRSATSTVYVGEDPPPAASNQVNASPTLTPTAGTGGASSYAPPQNPSGGSGGSGPICDPMRPVDEFIACLAGQPGGINLVQ